jgi:hypothetical protein
MVKVYKANFASGGETGNGRTDWTRIESYRMNCWTQSISMTEKECVRVARDSDLLCFESSDLVSPATLSQAETPLIPRPGPLAPAHVHPDFLTASLPQRPTIVPSPRPALPYSIISFFTRTGPALPSLRVHIGVQPCSLRRHRPGK